MLGEIGVLLLVLMAHVYLGGAIVGIWALFSCISNKLIKQALISFFSVVVITTTSLFCVLPFLKMHGGYSDQERIMIISLVAANIAFMIFISISRIRLILKINAKSAAITNRAGDNEKAAKHRRTIGYSWVISGGIGIMLVSYSILKRLSSSLELEMILGLIPGVTVSLLFLSGGFVLLRNLSWSYRLCLPISVVALMAFPIGSVLGGYYLWYYLKIERQLLKLPDTQVT